MNRWIVALCLIAVPRSVLAQSLAPTVRRISASVVGIRVEGAGGRRDGSGFVIDREHIVTSAALFDRGGSARVRLEDHRELAARLAGVDRELDLAVLTVDAPRLLPLSPADPEHAEPGEVVLAISRSFTGQLLVRAGVLSGQGGLGRGPVDAHLRTDALIEPGTEGAPLVNARGEVLGLTTVLSASGRVEGRATTMITVRSPAVPVAVAVPIDLLASSARQVIETGRVERVGLGLALEEMTADAAQQRGAGPNSFTLVTAVAPSSPAATAGLQPGDVILSFGGRAVRTPVELIRRVFTARAGQRLALIYARAGQTRTVEVALAVR